MAQTAAVFVSGGGTIDYTPSSAVNAGDVVIYGGLAMVAERSIEANKKGTLTSEGIWKMPKTTGAISAGQAVYWHPTASPVSGDASSGAASTTAASGYLLGIAVSAAGTNDAYVTVELKQQQIKIVESRTVAAAGSTQGTAAAIATGFNLVTAADGTKGVILPSASAGLVCIVKNADAADAVLKVYPATGDAINAIAANTEISMGKKTSATFVAYDDTTWYTIPLLPS